MKRYSKSLIATILFGFITGCGDPSTGNEKKTDETGAPISDTSYFYGARIITGDGSPALEDQSFIVSKGKITTIGPRKDVAPPKGSNRVDLTGRIVIPVFANVAAQPGMNNGAQYGPKNYTRDSLTADLSRYAYYGVMTVLTAGTDSGSLPVSIQNELEEGKIKGARLLTAGRGIAAKGGGPSALSGTTIQVTGAVDAKKAVMDLADEKVNAIKIWMDDGNGKGPRLSAPAYTAIIEEAHKQKLKVVAQIFSLSDAKDLAGAGVDGFVSSIRDRDVDDALIATMKQKNVFLAPALTAAEAKFVYADKPNWLGEQTMREVYPPQLLGYLNDQFTVDKFLRDPELASYRQQYALASKNLKRLSSGGVKIVLGTNSGAANTYPGYFELREMIAMADAGMSPMDVIKSATSASSEALGLTDLGTIAVGKTGDFLALPAGVDPLAKIADIKDLGQLYLDGMEQERSALLLNIKIDTGSLKITDQQRRDAAEQQRLAEIKKKEDAQPHYGGFILGQSVFVRSLSIPVPKGGKGEGKAGPPDRVSVSMKASANQLRDFYKEALPKYGWRTAGNCWEREHPSSKKTASLCLEAATNSVVIQITEK